MAALYQTSKEGILQCCVITTSSNGTMLPIHDRMPVILYPKNMQGWLTSSDFDHLKDLLKPAPDHVLRVSQVSDYVNNARNEGSKCMQTAEESAV